MTAPPYRSLADYKMAYYKGKLGLSVTANWSLSDLEYAYFYDQVVNGGANTGGGGGGGGTGVDLSTATGFLSADKVIDGTTNKVYPATDKTKLAGVATGATANSTDAQLKARANHTGTQLANTISDFDATAATSAHTALDANITASTARSNHTGVQSADTIIDGTTNKTYPATDQTKLAGIAIGATANSSDATLKNRANHTGTQASATISDFGTGMTSNAGPFLVAVAEPYTIYVNSSTGAWPNSGARTVPSGYTGPVVWDSQSFAGATGPSAPSANDYWDERTT